MNLPPIAWAILVMGLLWLGLRLWSRKAEQRRQEEREARMAELLAERERMLEARERDAPSSLGAVVSDSAPKAAEQPAERRCLGCRTVNPPDASVCASCGLEL
ncbi:MAG: hypothetical protein HYV09_36035 [Deltaproteobacteria bacterium]|nr:hypothetical protein [Deltaproteobacteria bacterium]